MTVQARLAAVLALAACSGPSGGATPDAAAPPPPACAGSPDLTAAAPTCNTVANDAVAVAFTAAAGAPPAAAGGTIRDGLYHATRAEGYGGVTPAGRRLTIAILGGGTRWLWAGEVLDAGGATVTLAFQADATAVAAGTEVALTTTCSSAATSPLPPALDYTATAEALVLSLTSTSGTSVTTYARAGCP